MTMRTIFHRTWNRMKKWWWMLLLIPLLTGSVSYYMTANAPTASTATVEIMLGNFQDSILTNETIMAEKLKTEKYLQSLTNSDEDFSEMTVEVKEGKILILSQTGDDAERAEQKLAQVTESLLEESDNVYEQKKNMLTKQVEDMEEHNPGSETLPKFSDELLNLRETDIHKEMSVATMDANAVKRGVFGVIVGLMLNVFLLALPEIFRD